MSRPLLHAAIALSSSLTIASPLLADSPQPRSHDAETPTILETATSAGSFVTLLYAVQKAGLGEALSGDGPFTVLAPTDEAFEALPAGALYSLLKPENREQLNEILTLHVIPGRINATEALTAGEAEALSGGGLEFSLEAGRLRINEANVLDNDLHASNGIIHVIDRVLLPAEPVVLKFRANWSHPVNESGVVADIIEITANGGGHVILTDVKAEVVRVSISGGASVTLTGLAGKLIVSQSGGSTLNALALDARIGRIQMTGGSNATVNISASLSVQANGSSTVRYAPRDVTIHEDVSRYSLVQRLDDHGQARSDNHH